MLRRRCPPTRRRGVTRLAPQPGERIDRGAAARLQLRRQAGAGLRRATRSPPRSTRPAGGRSRAPSSTTAAAACSCGAGQRPNRLVAVDGRPGVRACAEPLRDGMRVEHMNAQPALDFDVMRATDLFGGPFTPVGFYYKTFIRPRRLWPLYEKVLRARRRARAAARAAGRARVAHRVPPPPRRRARGRRRRRRARARRSPPPSWAPTSCSPTRARCRAGGCSTRAATSARAELAARARAAGVEMLSGAAALGCFDGLVPVWQGDTLHQVRARAARRSRPARSSSRWSSPTTTARGHALGRRAGLVARYAVAPGERAVVVTTCDRGLAAARDLRARGRRDRRRRRPARRAATARGRAARRARARRHTVVAAKGGRALSAAVLGPLGRHDGERSVDCDLLVVSGGEAPAASLRCRPGRARATTRGRATSRSPSCRRARTPRAAWPATGAEAELSGGSPALAAAHALGRASGASREPVQRGARAGRGAARGQRRRPAGAASSTSTRT